MFVCVCTSASLSVCVWVFRRDEHTYNPFPSRPYANNFQFQVWAQSAILLPPCHPLLSILFIRRERQRAEWMLKVNFLFHTHTHCVCMWRQQFLACVCVVFLWGTTFLRHIFQVNIYEILFFSHPVYVRVCVNTCINLYDLIFISCYARIKILFVMQKAHPKTGDFVRRHPPTRFYFFCYIRERVQLLAVPEIVVKQIPERYFR